MNAAINSQNTEPLREPIHGRGVILISFLETVFENIWTEFNWIGIGPVTDSC
jgi:hypothetical protein